MVLFVKILYEAFRVTAVDLKSFLTHVNSHSTEEGFTVLKFESKLILDLTLCPIQNAKIFTC